MATTLWALSSTIAISSIGSALAVSSSLIVPIPVSIAVSVTIVVLAVLATSVAGSAVVFLRHCNNKSLVVACVAPVG